MDTTKVRLPSTHIQKHDIEANWLKSTLVPAAGQIIVYDVEVDKDGKNLELPEGRTVPYTYERFKIGDGIHKVTELTFSKETEQTIVLEEDLYTYANVGKITGASNTSPKKVASKGDSLKAVFNTVFGVQQDTNPTITNNSSLSVSAGTTSYGGGEFGTSVASTDVTITFTLNHSGTVNYGYRIGTTKTTGSQTFYYPVTKQDGSDLVITLPTGKSAEVTAGVLNKTVDNKLYCDFNSSKKVSIKINLPAGSVTTAQQTRYGQISASVILGAPQKENQITEGTKLDAFLTYLKNDYAVSNGGTKSGTAGAYIIKAGAYYPYYATTLDTSVTSFTTAKQSTTDACTNSGQSIDIGSNSHIWFLLQSASGAKSIQYEALGQWYDFGGGTSGPVDVKLTLNSGIEADYKAYYTNAKAAAGTTKFRIK